MKTPTRLGPLVAKVEEIARTHFDGHFSVFSFTTNYKGCFGTPDGPRDVEDLPAHGSIESLLFHMSETPENYIFLSSTKTVPVARATR